ncbi:hypothetical protein IKS_05968, partial [Bacillus cereus VDM062]
MPINLTFCSIPKMKKIVLSKVNIELECKLSR